MTIHFETKLLKVGPKLIIRIPLSSSEKLPSRGMVMVEGTLNDVNFKAPLEPDGKGSHWMECNSSLRAEAGISINETIVLTIEPLNKWLEPEVPQDIMDMLKKEELMSQWNSITTKARWDWLRWIRATQNPETREKRIDVASSKLKNGDKNPCCFDRTRCTITDVSKSGVLLES